MPVPGAHGGLVETRAVLAIAGRLAVCGALVLIALPESRLLQRRRARRTGNLHRFACSHRRVELLLGDIELAQLVAGRQAEPGLQLVTRHEVAHGVGGLSLGDLLLGGRITGQRDGFLHRGHFVRGPLPHGTIICHCWYHDRAPVDRRPTTSGVGIGSGWWR